VFVIYIVLIIIYVLSILVNQKVLEVAKLFYCKILQVARLLYCKVLECKLKSRECDFNFKIVLRKAIILFNSLTNFLFNI